MSISNLSTTIPGDSNKMRRMWRVQMWVLMEALMRCSGALPPCNYMGTPCTYLTDMSLTCAGSEDRRMREDGNEHREICIQNTWMEVVETPFMDCSQIYYGIGGSPPPVSAYYAITTPLPLQTVLYCDMSGPWTLLHEDYLPINTKYSCTGGRPINDLGLYYDQIWFLDLGSQLVNYMESANSIWNNDGFSINIGLFQFNGGNYYFDLELNNGVCVDTDTCTPNVPGTPGTGGPPLDFDTGTVPGYNPPPPPGGYPPGPSDQDVPGPVLPTLLPYFCSDPMALLTPKSPLDPRDIYLYIPTTRICACGLSLVANHCFQQLKFPVPLGGKRLTGLSDALNEVPGIDCSDFEYTYNFRIYLGFRNLTTTNTYRSFNSANLLTIIGTIYINPIGCPTGCETCINGTMCLTCSVGYAFCKLYTEYAFGTCNVGCGGCPAGPGVLGGACGNGKCVYIMDIVCDITCSTCSGAGVDKCMSCVAGRVRCDGNTVGTGSCLSDCSSCLLGGKYTYPDTGVCTECHTDCEKCVDGTSSKCLSCASPAYFCEEVVPCGLCVSSCHTGCTSANSLSILNTYPNITTNECNPCHAECLTCANATNFHCLSCLPPKELCLQQSTQSDPLLNIGECTNDDCASCTIGGRQTIKVGDICGHCHVSCATCDGPLDIHCTSCNLGRFLCTDTLLVERKCKFNCGTQCITAAGILTYEDYTLHQCLVCDSTNCLFNCPYGQYLSAGGGSCVGCSLECEDCFGATASECTVCAAGYILYTTTCGTSCPSSHFGVGGSIRSCIPCGMNCATCLSNSNCQTCTAGFYGRAGSGACFPAPQILCALDCVECTSPTECILCASGLFLYGGTCLTLCPSHTFLEGNGFVCSQCHPSCLSCFGGSLYNCSSCALPYYLSTYDHQCSSVCGPGEYLHVGGECKLCYALCGECSGPLLSHCTSCLPPYIFTMSPNISRCTTCEEIYPAVGVYRDGGCQEVCGKGRNYGGLPCDDGNTLDGDGCSQSCQVEHGFLCTLGDSNTPDLCRYIIPLYIQIVTRNKNNIVFAFSQLALIDHHDDRLLLEAVGWSEERELNPLFGIQITGEKFEYAYEYNLYFKYNGEFLREILLSIDIKSPLLGGEVLRMDFVEFNIRERSGKLLSNPVQRVILEKYNYISEEEDNFVIRAGEILGIASISFLSLGLFFHIITGLSSSIIWAAINMLQIISLIPLLNIPLPRNLHLFILNYLTWYNFRFTYFDNYIHNSQIFNLSQINDNPLNERFEENGYKSLSIIINFTGQILIGIFLFGLYPPLNLLAKITSRKLFVRAKQIYEYKLSLFALNECFMELTLVFLISLYQFEFNDSSTGFSSLITFIVAMIIPGYLIGSLNLVTNNSCNLRSKLTVRKYGILYSEFKSSEKSRMRLCHIYNTVFLLRRGLYALILVFLRSSPWIQMYTSIGLHMLIIIITQQQSAYSRKYMGYLVSFLDITILLIFCILPAFLCQGMSLAQENALGRVIIVIILIAVITCYLFYLHKVIQSLLTKCKAKGVEPMEWNSMDYMECRQQFVANRAPTISLNTFGN